MPLLPSPCNPRNYGATSATSDIGDGWRSALSVHSLYEALEDRQSKLQATSASVHELERINHTLSAENEALRQGDRAELQSFIAEIHTLKAELARKDSELRGEMSLHDETRSLLENLKTSVSFEAQNNKRKPRTNQSDHYQLNGSGGGGGGVFDVGQSYEDMALEDRFDARSVGGVLSTHRVSRGGRRPDPNTSTAAAAKRAAMSVTSLQKALEQTVDEKLKLLRQYQATLAENERVANELDEWKQHARSAVQAERESRTHLAVGMIFLGSWSGKQRLLRKSRAFRKWCAIAAGESEKHKVDRHLERVKVSLGAASDLKSKGLALAVGFEMSNKAAVIHRWKRWVEERRAQALALCRMSMRIKRGLLGSTLQLWLARVQTASRHDRLLRMVAQRRLQRHRRVYFSWWSRIVYNTKTHHLQCFGDDVEKERSRLLQRSESAEAHVGDLEQALREASEARAETAASHDAMVGSLARSIDTNRDFLFRKTDLWNGQQHLRSTFGRWAAHTRQNRRTELLIERHASHIRTKRLRASLLYW
jgi:hypothetical protein